MKKSIWIFILVLMIVPFGFGQDSETAESAEETENTEIVEDNVGVDEYTDLNQDSGEIDLEETDSDTNGFSDSGTNQSELSETAETNQASTNMIDTNQSEAVEEAGESSGEKEEEGLVQFGMGFEIGSLNFGGENYQTVRLKPDIGIWKIGIGLDLNLEFNAQGDIRVEEWNTWQAVVSKISYLRFGRKNENVYVKIGGIENAVLGNGFIFQGFQNRYYYPQIRKIGLIFDARLPFFPAGFETISGNVLDRDLFGFRVYAYPLSFLPVPVVNKLQIGITEGIDFDPMNPEPSANQPYAFTDSPYSQTVSVTGLDLSLPVLNNPMFGLKLFADTAMITGKGVGLQFGGSGNVAVFVPYRISFNYSAPYFIPSYFNSIYETERSTKYQSLTNRTQSLMKLTGSSGISLFENALSWKALIDFPLTDGEYPDFYTGIVVTRKLVKRLEGEISWQKNDIENVQDFINFEAVNSRINGRVSYVISKNLSLSLLYKRSYELNEGGTAEAFETTSISTEIRF